MAMTIELPEDLSQCLAQAAAEQGKPVAELVRHALEGWLTDWADIQDARRVLNDPDTEWVPWEQAKAELGL